MQNRILRQRKGAAGTTNAIGSGKMKEAKRTLSTQKRPNAPTVVELIRSKTTVASSRRGGYGSQEGGKMRFENGLSRLIHGKRLVVEMRS